jgi:HK97 family phage portal protein
MKIFGYDINFKATKVDNKNKIGDTITYWDDNRKNFADVANKSSLLNSYRSWVYVCANKNAINFAQQKLKLYVTKQSNEKLRMKTKAISKDTERIISNDAGVYSLSCVKKAIEIEEVTEHPFYDIMKNINKFMNRFEFMEMIDLHQELTGNAYVYVVNNQLGVPFEFWLLQPDRMIVIPSKDTWIAGYIYLTKDGREIPFTLDEIIHFKFPNPNDQYYGWSPLAAMADSYNINLAYAKYEKSLMDNSAIPPIALVGAKDVTYTDADFKRIITRWNKTYGGASNQGKTAWLEGGFDVKTLNVSPKDMAYLSGRKWTREELAAGYGVPISKLTSESVNRSNAEAGDYQYLADTINPRCIRFAEKLNEKLIPLYDERLFVMFDDVVPENKEFKLKERESNITNKITVVNEERKKLGIEEVEWGQFPIVQSGMVPYKGQDAPPPAAPGSGGFGKTPEEIKAEQDMEKEKLKLEQQKKKEIEEFIATTIADEIIEARG